MLIFDEVIFNKPFWLYHWIIQLHFIIFLIYLIVFLCYSIISIKRKSDDQIQLYLLLFYELYVDDISYPYGFLKNVIF
jgi:hypothetical protein